MNNRNQWNLMVVGISLLMISLIGLQAYGTFQELSKTQLGAEVQTTAEYGLLFNDSFSGRVVGGERFMDSSVTIHNMSTGIERRIETRWIEMKKDRR